MNARQSLLMVLGPVQMEQEILDAARCQVPYPRTPEYSEWYREINENLQYLFQTERPVFTVTCSGSGVLQMAVDNLLSPDDTALTFATGTFGKRWGDIARAKAANVIETPMAEGENVTPEILQVLLQKHPDAKTIFLTHNETSTTALADVKGCAKLVRDTDKLIVVDAVSALGAEPMQMDDWGIDVLLTSSQKALALPPGLGFIAFSAKAWERVLRRPCQSFYFDARAYEKEWLRNQVPFTPSLSVVLQLKKRLSAIRAEGLEVMQERYRQLTAQLRSGLEKLGFTFLSSDMGNCTTAVCVPSDIDASALVTMMRLEHGIAFGAPYAGSNCFRIGNFGAITSKDISYCLSKLKTAMSVLQNA